MLRTFQMPLVCILDMVYNSRSLLIFFSKLFYLIFDLKNNVIVPASQVQTVFKDYQQKKTCRQLFDKTCIDSTMC